MPQGWDRALSILPFGHRGSFQSGLLGFKPPLSGFAAGRTAFRNPPVGRLVGSATRHQAVERIAGRYRKVVDIVERG